MPSELPTRTVIFEETGEERVVKRGCHRCYPLQDWDEIVLVSPNGTAHHGCDYGMTCCGKDATGPRWWWRL